ncbi:MAG: hypothetical protein FJ285_01960 [Planctomycetes bacterium]|nr:hypothetical protein [Planctomycetota bacterium]
MMPIAAVQSETRSSPPVLPDEWAITPDVMLFAAAAVLTLVVSVFAVWLFRRAAREERRS